MNMKTIRKLPELKGNQEWACEGGCDVIRPKHLEHVFSESHAHDGSSINRQSEFFYTCQNKHLLGVWCKDKGEYVLLPEEFYQEQAPKVVETNSLDESIDLLSKDIDLLKEKIIQESLLTNDEADNLEHLITEAMKFGELLALRDAKAQVVPEGFEQAYSEIFSPIIKRPYPRLENGDYKYIEMDQGLKLWQVAQAQVVPEGFVVLKISDVRDILSNASDAICDEKASTVFSETGSPSTWYDHHLVAEKNILDAIEAQEPNHE